MKRTLDIDMDAIPRDDSVIRFDRMLAKSPLMKDILREALLAAATDIPVLLLGETGTGKDLVAQSIHTRSPRRDAPFVALNLGALPTELVASELFGHEKGAFTGAAAASPGKISMAEKGTLFLDEVDSMDVKAQVALLRVLENREYYRVGGRHRLTCDVRVVAASNADLSRLVAEGTFRQDLFYRLEGFTIHLPPLRERHGGIPMLAREFLKEINASHGLEVREISPAALQSLEAYAWPGNIRELRNAVQRAALLARKGVLEPAHLPARLRSAKPHPASVAPAAEAFSTALGRPLRTVEAEYIRNTLAMTHGNKALAARLLKISRKALYQKLR